MSEERGFPFWQIYLSYFPRYFPIEIDAAATFMIQVYINGKFFDQPTTGVQRFALEVVSALDALLIQTSSGEFGTFQLIVPSGVKHKIPPLKHIQVVELTGFRSHLWEQLLLPIFVRNAFLINLSGSGPVFKRRQMFAIHDAAIFDFPQAYTRMFRVWYKFQFWLQARRAQALLTVSEFSRDRLCKHLGIETGRFCVVSNGVNHIHRIESDDGILSELGLKSSQYLLAVGSSNPSKNFATLIEAFSAMKNIDAIRLVVVGGSNPAVFAEQVVSCDPRILRTGRVSDSQLKALYTNARAFVFPSFYEGFGIPPLEAMACGCPVIASDAASIPEICGDADGYFDPYSILSIQTSLERIIIDGDWRARLRAAGNRKAKEYTWAAAAEQLLLQLSKVESNKK